MPVLKEAEPLRLIQITDLHLKARAEEGLGWCTDCATLNTTQTLKTVLDDIQVNEPWFDALVVTGDIAQDGEAEAYRRFVGLLANEGAPVYCLPGNHDDKRKLLAALDGEIVSMPRHVVMQQWLLLFLDSACRSDDRGEISPLQLTWIEAMAARYPQHHIVLFVHHHPVPVGSAWLDRGLGMVNGQEMLERLARLPRIRALVCGHIHQQLDTRYEGIQILGTPSTCLQFEPGSDRLSFAPQAPAYRRLVLHANGRVETEVVFSHQPWLLTQMGKGSRQALSSLQAAPPSRAS